MLLITLLTSFVFAQNSATKEKVHTLDFEETEIEGKMMKPTGELVEEKTQVFFHPLLELREDFQFEMFSSINEIE